MRQYHQSRIMEYIVSGNKKGSWICEKETINIEVPGNSPTIYNATPSLRSIVVCEEIGLFIRWWG